MSMLNMLLGIGGSGTVSTLDIVDPFLDKSGIALYKMDGNAQDAGGLYNGTATSVTYGTGKFGQGVVFNQSNSRVTAVAPMSSNVYSISFWIHPTSVYNKGIFDVTLVRAALAFNANSVFSFYDVSYHVFSSAVSRGVFSHVALGFKSTS